MNTTTAAKVYTITGTTAGAVVYTETVTGYKAASDRLSAVSRAMRDAGTRPEVLSLRGPTGRLFVSL